VDHLQILNIYKEYVNSKYVISLTPFENDYLFKKWGINSILFDNFLTYEYNSTMPSNLKENKILLIGRGREKMKRFDLGIQAMEYIKDVLSDSKLMIIAKNKSLDNLINTVNNLNLNNNIEFAMYSSDPSIYFNSASLNFLTSLSESYSLSLSETKIFGIPTISYIKK
jgi:hypothetical protein